MGVYESAGAEGATVSREVEETVAPSKIYEDVSSASSYDSGPSKAKRKRGEKEKRGELLEKWFNISIREDTDAAREARKHFVIWIGIDDIPGRSGLQMWVIEINIHKYIFEIFQTGVSETGEDFDFKKLPEWTAKTKKNA